MNTRPLVTVVTAVFDRPEELRRCLSSLQAQSMGDFECIVVDDASRLPIEPVVSDFDDRFIYVRNPSNLGPAGAKRAGFERMRGQFLSTLDSDDEYFPWMLDRATMYLDQEPEVGGVTGLWVYPQGLPVRIPGGRAVFTRHDYVMGNLTPVDCLPMVRRASVDEWLKRRPDYFATEFVFALSHRLRHSQLYVDEPWGRKNFDAPDRVSTRRDPRLYRDVVTFVEDHRDEIGTEACAPVDNFLRESWLSLLRVGRWNEARLVAAWMRERGIGRLRTMLDGVPRKLLARLGPADSQCLLQPLAQQESTLSRVARDR